MTRLDHPAARRDLAAFAEMVGWPMSDWQAESLRLDARATVLVAGRQMGKSRSLSLLALWWAFRKSNQRVLVISAGEEASRRLLSTVRQIATGSRLLSGSVVDEGASLLRLTNGSEVRSVPASERQVRGWAVDLLLVDEASLVADDLLLGAAFPTTTARPDARIVLASTPLAADGGFYRQAMAGLDGRGKQVRTFVWKAKAAGGDRDAHWITREVIEHQEATLTSDRFRREYLCEWAATSDVLFTPALLAECSADLDLPQYRELTGPMGLYAGLDWAGGTGRDRTVLATIARLPVEGDPLWVGWIAGTWQQTAIHDVAAQIVTARPALGLLTSETNGLGLPAFDELRRVFRRRGEVIADATGNQLRSGPKWNPVPITAARKADAYFRLRTLCERGQLILQRDENLLRELAGLRVETRPTGSVGIEAGSSSGHDDRADALMLATGPFPKGDPATALARAVGNAHPVAATDRDVPTVKTGAGREMPQRPSLLAVRGEHLTRRDVRREAVSDHDDLIRTVRNGLAGEGVT